MSKENKKTGTSFEMCGVNVFPRSAILLTCEAVRHAQERTSPPFILGKPITDIEHLLFGWLFLFVCLSSAIRE